jgi:hypothetical protein
MANEWHYTKDGQRFGPVSGQQLKELAATGQLGPDDLVWKEGMKQWLPASKVKGLLPGPGATTTQDKPGTLVKPPKQEPSPDGEPLSKRSGLSGRPRP